MNILRMRYFIDVATHKSFTKAAQQNYVSQTAVSQQIAAIEKELEVQLFHREKGKVELTRAGELFFHDCVRLVGMYEKAVAKAKRAHHESGETLTLGILTGSKIDYIYDIAKRVSERCPGTTIKPVQSSFAGMRRELESGALDMGLTIHPALVGMEHCCKIQRLFRVKMGLLVSLKNPLAQYDEIFAKDVENEDIIMISPQFGDVIFTHMLEMRKKEGYLPNIVETVDSNEILVMMVEMNRGSAFLPEETAQFNKKLCKMLHIKDNEDYVDYALAWQKSDNSKTIKAVVDCIKDFFDTDLSSWLASN